MNAINGLRAERLIAKRYEEQGYSVTTEPSPLAIPFSLGNYRPDILAIKGKEKLLIEVKGPGARIDREVYLRVDEEVQKHEGWRFLLVSVSAEDLREGSIGTSSNLSANVNVATIRERLDRTDPLLEQPEVAGLLLPHLWLAYISALRLNAACEGVSQEGLTDFSLINRAYSEGITSIDEFEEAKRFLSLRNETAHNLAEVPTPLECKQLRQMIDVVLCRIEHPDC